MSAQRATKGELCPPGGCHRRRCRGSSHRAVDEAALETADPQQSKPEDVHLIGVDEDAVVGAVVDDEVADDGAESGRVAVKKRNLGRR